MERIHFDGRTFDMHHFLLLDPLQVELDAAQRWCDLPLLALAPPGFEAQSRQLPYLLAWRELNAEQRTRLPSLLANADEMPTGAMCVALLQSDVQTVHLQHHLRQLLSPQFPSGERGIFRFYDPVVFAHLSWMLDDPQRAVMFGPVASWAFPAGDRWCMQATPSLGSHHVRFAPGAAMWTRIARIGALHAVLGTEASWCAEPATFGPQAEILLIRAEVWGLEDRDDAVAFVRHGLLRHPRFDTHPAVADTLRQCKGHPTRYRRLTSQWSEADWQAIAHDLERPAGNASPTLTDFTMQGAR